ncbi:MAG: hypothetical protein GTN59_11715 [Candidatus Dadabacteria bacterium]|nr:hypothetical protein [Candidatus Dadabacteria bacterium]
MKKKRRMFFGWSNVRWLIKEFMKIYSTEDSYFSKKRIESGIAFVIAQWGMIYFLVKNIDNMSTSDLTLWSGVEFLIAGYTVHQIQREKKKNEPEKDGGGGEGPQLLEG